MLNNKTATTETSLIPKGSRKIVADDILSYQYIYIFFFFVCVGVCVCVCVCVLFFFGLILILRQNKAWHFIWIIC